MRSGVFATPTCATTRLPRQEFIGSGWGTRVGSRSVRARRCPTVTTRPNTKGRYARNGPKERAWASSFRAGSSQSRSESWFNFGNKIVVLDRMDRKPKFWPCKKWPQAYDTIVVVRLFPGSSTVEHSAVNRRVASSNLARGAKILLYQAITEFGQSIRLATECLGLRSEIAIAQVAEPKSLFESPTE